MKIFTIILTAGRDNLLERCLDSSLHSIPNNCIYVFQNGIKVSPSIKQKYRSEKIIFELFTEKLNLGEARNRAVNSLKARISDHDWVLFADDDIVFPESYWKQVVDAIDFAEKNNIMLIGGPNLGFQNSNHIEKIQEIMLSEFLISGLVSKRYKLDKSKIVNNDFGLILCNLFLSGRLVKEKLFSNYILGGEENLFFENFFREKRNAYFCKDIYVYHKRRKDLVSFIRQIFKYGFGRGQVLKYSKTPNLYYLGLVFLFLVLFYLNIKFPMLLIFFGIYLLILALKLMKKYSIIKSILVLIIFPFYMLSYFIGVLTGLVWPGEERGFAKNIF